MNKVRVLSFGAGTQSSALLGLIEEGRLPPVDLAIFADTQCEPKEVYEWLAKIKTWAKTEIRVLTKGDLLKDTLRLVRGEGTRFASLPFHTFSKAGVNDAEDGKAILRRQCTSEYKIEVVQRGVRDYLGYKPRQHVKHQVDMLIAMSLDEVTRMRDSREKWITNRYPLIFDVPMHRQQSIDYVQTFGLGIPPRSSCLMCPFHSDAEWKRIRDTDPVSWNQAVAFDKECRQLPRIKSQTFLHPSLRPLDEVDLDTPSDQMDLFTNECEGMCGV